MEEMPKPQCGPQEVVVQVMACGLCGSDIHGYLDPASKGRVEGLIMGHEPSGIIAEVGPQVDGFAPGDRVIIDPQFRCNTCYACKQSFFNICENGGIIGSALRAFHQGAMAEFVAVNASHLHKLPDSLSFEEGAMIEPVANAIHAVNRAGVKIGDYVAIVGAGTIGLCMVQAAKIAGAAKVIAIDVSPFHLDLAEELGADYLVNSKLEDPIARVLEICDGIGTHVTIEAVGIGETYRQAALMTRKRGTLIFFGAVGPTAEIHLYPILHRELNALGCTGFDVETDIGLFMLQSGKMTVKPLITHRYPLHQIQTAIDDFAHPKEGMLKAIIMPHLG